MSQINLAAKSLEEILSRDNVVADLTRALSLLHSSGILNFLQQRTVVNASVDTDNLQSLASTASWKAGYAECLTDLILFRERYIAPQRITVPVKDYGGIDIAVAAGNLTKEEANALRSGKLNELESQYKTPKPAQRTS